MPKIILVVDDDSSILHIISSILLKNGYEVITAPNGAVALELIKTNKPDLVITDLVMPVMDGWYFSMKVRENLRFKTTPIIVISGLLEAKAGQQEHEDATFYMPKPLNTSTLIEKIKELLSDRNP